MLTDRPIVAYPALGDLKIMKRPLVIGHRGALAHAPENTLLSFETAWRLGADWIELDVHRTADGILVCIHDDDLIRICGRSEKISTLNWDEIREIDVGQGQHIPSLEEVLQFARDRLGVNIELKMADLEAEVLRCVSSHEMLKSVMISSFMHSSLQIVRSLDSSVMTAVLYSEPMENPVEYAHDLGADAINPLFFTIEPETVKAAHEIGLSVYPWTVNDPDMMTDLINIGVDGIITDYPDIAVHVIKERHI